MNPWVPFAGALVYNYACHRRGRPTICSTTRRFVPPVAFLVGWATLTEFIVPHYIDGFRIDLTSLTD